MDELSEILCYNQCFKGDVDYYAMEHRPYSEGKECTCYTSCPAYTYMHESLDKYKPLTANKDYKLKLVIKCQQSTPEGFSFSDVFSRVFQQWMNKNEKL